MRQHEGIKRSIKGRRTWRLFAPAVTLVAVFLALSASASAAGALAGSGVRQAAGGSASDGKRLAADALPAGALMKVGSVDWWSSSSYSWGNTSGPDVLAYYSDAAGMMTVVRQDELRDSDILAIDTFNLRTRRRIGRTRSVSLAGWPDWGGFYAGADGCFYVLLGRGNYRENNDRKVVAVRRYDHDWTLLGTAYVLGSASQLVKGIYSPFDASAPQMTLVGDRLVVHMGRLLYAIEGVHHQANLTFEVDVEAMTASTFDDLGESAYCSHSFRQLVATNGSSLVMIDHGDAYPRAIQMGVMADYPIRREVRTYDLFEFNGGVGNNFTGATVTGLVSGPSGVVVVGNSIRHPDAPNGTLGSNGERRNVYAIWADPATGAHKVRWLTRFAPRGAGGADEPRVVQVGVDRFAVLFSVQDSGNYRMECRVIDSAGTVLASKSFPGVFFSAISDPILIGGKVYWVGVGPVPQADMPVCLYAIDVRPFPPSSAKEITAFRFTSPPVSGDIDQTAHTVSLTVPSDTDVTALVPTITTTGASVSPRSGATADFTDPVTYTVTAADGSSQLYTVTVTVETLPPTTIAIGDAYGGGIVTYIYRPGDPGFVVGETHGLIAAKVDQTSDSGVEWATRPYQYTAAPGALGTAIGSGATNTAAIIAMNGSGRTYAAGLAQAYWGGGHKDWFLPSKDELHQLYLNRFLIGGFNTTEDTEYWSSSQAANEPESQWSQDFSDGYQATGASRNNTFRVRAVRAF